MIKEKKGDGTLSGEGELRKESSNRSTATVQVNHGKYVVMLHGEVITTEHPLGQIVCPNDKYYFNVIVNPALEGADAMVSPAYKLDVGESDKVVTVIPRSIGLIQFRTIEDFTSGVISHEAVHCATAYMRLFEKDRLKLDLEDCDDNEERLAWLIGWFTARLTNYYYDFIEPLEKSESG